VKFKLVCEVEASKVQTILEVLADEVSYIVVKKVLNLEAPAQGSPPCSAPESPQRDLLVVASPPAAEEAPRRIPDSTARFYPAKVSESKTKRIAYDFARQKGRPVSTRELEGELRKQGYSATQSYKIVGELIQDGIATKCAVGGYTGYDLVERTSAELRVSIQRVKKEPGKKSAVQDTNIGRTLLEFMRTHGGQVELSTAKAVMAANGFRETSASSTLGRLAREGILEKIDPEPGSRAPSYRLPGSLKDPHLHRLTS
jgi:hypothetical protein